MYSKIFIIFGVSIALVACDQAPEKEARVKRAFQAFQFIKFPNDACSGGTRNGTCFTAEECTTKGGSGSGTCANGYGVCCVFALSCGGSTSYNVSYLVQGAVNKLNSPCQYTICQSNPAVCRIRFDFKAFSIASPNLAQVDEVGIGTDVGSGIGNCVVDSFAITTPGSKGSPVICGSNDGQHMIIDAGVKGTCLTATFLIGQVTTVARNWDIKVTQYDCGDINGGPAGCLQYFTGVSQSFASYNFPLAATKVTSTFTHLANQQYDICIRRESGFCFICYLPTLTPGVNTVINQNSFGLSVTDGNIAGDTDALSNANAGCSTDYLAIPGGNDRARTLQTFRIPTVLRVCGRHLNINNGAAESVSVCSRSAPFKLTFVTNNIELAFMSTDGTSKTAEIENFEAPGGSIGFQLTYTQLRCGTTA